MVEEIGANSLGGEELVYNKDGLTWGDVGRAFGVGESRSTRQSSRLKTGAKASRSRIISIKDEEDDNQDDTEYEIIWDWR